jgi:1-deoxy-D-xylulose-5-phosphate synthase
MIIMTPSDENECRQLLTTAFMQEHPSAVRYPRGSGVGATVDPSLTSLQIGKGVVRRQVSTTAKKRLAVLAFGTLLQPCLEVGEQLDLTVVDMRFVKPIDEELLKALSIDHVGFITIEEGAIQGGAGSACMEFFASQHILLPVLQLGLPDTFIDQGDSHLLLANCGLSAAGIEQSIRGYFNIG